MDYKTQLDWRTNKSTYEVWSENLGMTEDDSSSVEACSPENAAELWCEEYDSETCSYDFVSNRIDAPIHVKSPDGTIRIYSIEGRSIPHYEALLRETIHE